MEDEMKTERVQLMMTPTEVQTIDDWSFANRVRGRSEAIRRLIEAGLKAPATEPDEAGPKRHKEVHVPVRKSKKAE